MSGLAVSFPFCHLPRFPSHIPHYHGGILCYGNVW